MLKYEKSKGTYTRTMALNRIIDSFLDGEHGQDGTKNERQIISLGAGTDTRCFRLFSQQNRQRPLIYHEVDFPSISSRKRMIVQATPALAKILPKPVPSGDGSDMSSWRSDPGGKGNEYWCHGLDLRDIARNVKSEGGQVELMKRLAGLRTDIPTLLVSECCLCYLETADAEDVVRYFVDRIPDLGIVLYEPTKPDDAFGKQMVSNLAARRIKMPALDVYKEPKDQEQRLRQAGLTSVAQQTVDKIWERWVSSDEKERLDGLEGLDEVEEWQLLAAHYIVAWGSRGHGFGAWRNLVG